MKSSISLDARIFDNGQTRYPPIAPPRKKRTTLKKGSTLPTSFKTDDVVRNGFKDVFGKTNGYEDIEYIDKEEESDLQTSTPEKEKKLRVGNKKSDKFFGEDLSDHLSDEPVSPILSKHDDSKNSEESEKSETEKKLSYFLMNMLDDIRDNGADVERYKGQVEVEEPIFVARKKEIKKHICDDDDHLHHMHFHHNHDHEKENCDHHIAPRKPERDFSKFKTSDEKSINESLEKEIQEEKVEDIFAKVRVKRGISRENLPSPPATPANRKSGAPQTPTIVIDAMELTLSEKNTIPENKELKDLKEISQSRESLKEQIDSENHKISELVNEIITKAYGISGGFDPEDHPHGTHDEVLEPTSKLAVRKISTPRKVSTEVAPITENEVFVTSSELLSSSLVKAAQEEAEKTLKEESIRTLKEIPKQNEPNKVKEVSSKDEEDVKSEGAAASTMSDIIDEIYSRNSNVMKEFQTFLEQSIEKNPVINVEEEKKFIDTMGILGDDADKSIKENEDEMDNQSFSDSFESSDTEQEVLTKTNNANKIKRSPRRESIEDVDNWFSHHIEMEQKESEVCNVREPRQSIGYDTNKIFPFGETIQGRRDSTSDEFFTEYNSGALLRKQPIVIENSILEEQRCEDDVRESSKSPDHSTLLKYLDSSVKK